MRAAFSRQKWEDQGWEIEVAGAGAGDPRSDRLSPSGKMDCVTLSCDTFEAVAHDGCDGGWFGICLFYSERN